MKTLKEVMKKLNKERFNGNVYIGGKDGSSFFYIGPYDKEKIQEVYDRLDKDIRKQSEDANSKLERQVVAGMAEDIQRLKNQDLKRFEEKAAEVRKAYAKDAEKCKNAINNLRKNIIRSDLEIELQLVKELFTLSNRVRIYEKYKDVSYKENVEDVTVEEYYPKTDPNEPGMIIILSGCQKGNLWLVKEVEEKAS